MFNFKDLFSVYFLKNLLPKHVFLQRAELKKEKKHSYNLHTPKHLQPFINTHILITEIISFHLIISVHIIAKTEIYCSIPWVIISHQQNNENNNYGL